MSEFCDEGTVSSVLGQDFSSRGAIVGVVFAVGVVLVWRGLPVNRRPTLTDRLAPYVRDAPRPSRLLAVTGAHVPLVVRLVAPMVATLGRAIERVLGGSASVRHRLLRAGQSPDVERFRASQVVWGAAGGVMGVGVAVLISLARDGVLGPGIAVSLLAVAIGVVAKDQWLSHQASRRESRMLAEFPTIAELLALAVAAGEGAVGALDRVTRLSRGELSGELARCLADARAGANLPTALQGLADRTALPNLSRFVDGIVVAVQRGTPLAEVLRAQAQDVREAGKRAVMESAGRREIAMMAPVVFLILPVTVLFAIYPGFEFLKFTI